MRVAHLCAKKKQGNLMATYLIVGLGNPGRKYAKTRHNAGFIMLDKLADKTSTVKGRWQGEHTSCGALTEGSAFSKFKSEKKFAAEIATCHLSSVTCLLAKPQTYMNLSGQSVAKIAKFHKIPPQNIIVIFDDINIPLGEIRTRLKGSAGGHNGMKSIIAHLGTEDFPRIRIGIGGEEQTKDTLSDYVLKKFNKEEKKAIDNMYFALLEELGKLISKDGKY